jgi:hypothetical protein
MRRTITAESLLCCVVLLMFGTAATADEAPLVEPALEDGPDDGLREPDADMAPYEVPEDLSHEGVPAAWGGLFPHFLRPTRSFSVFRSQTSYGWHFRDRCAATPWTPRGNGIPKRSSCFRMDYAPYQLEHNVSAHGPAYHQRFAIFPCPECPTHATHLRYYYGGGKVEGCKDKGGKRKGY